MCETIFTTIITPLLVGIILLLIQKWLDDSAD
ncbi:type I toxin-antitoxin system Fst family toxin [Streptococcus dysgalactiae]